MKFTKDSQKDESTSPSKSGGKAEPQPEGLRRRQQFGGKARNFKRVNYVLNNVMTKLGLERRLREHTLMSLWPTLVGPPWSNRSRPLFIDAEFKLVVSVSDAATGQELSLLKSDILTKVKAAGRAVGVTITGLRFDLKHYYGSQAEELLSQAVSPSLPEPTAAELASIELSEHNLAELAVLKTDLENSTAGAANPLPARILIVFENELRRREWMRQKGFPTCAQCRHPVRTLHGRERLCPACFWGAR
jgi:hypothetical protein